MYPSDLKHTWGTTKVGDLFNVKDKVVLITGKLKDLFASM